MHVASSRKGALPALDELAVHIGLNDPPVRVLIEGGRAALRKVFERPVSVSQQGFRQNGPSLNLAEDAPFSLVPGLNRIMAAPSKASYR